MGQLAWKGLEYGYTLVAVKDAFTWCADTVKRREVFFELMHGGL